MFEVWKLKLKIWRLRRRYAPLHEALELKKAQPEEFEALEVEEFEAVSEIEKEIDIIESGRLFRRARHLDVETPPFSEKEMWQDEYGGRRIWFTPKGRARVRKLIHEEKTRRFEAKSRWVPLLSIVLAIIGTITGLVALTVQRKSAEAAATAAGTARINAELTRKQLVGTQQAIVVFSPNFSGSTINPVLENHGHVVSKNAHVNFRWGIAPLSNLDAFVQQGTYSQTISQLVIGGSNEPLDIGAKLGQEFSRQKYTVKIDGTYDFDNGFGDRFSNTFCYFYLAHYRASMEAGGVESGGPSFWPCSNFAQKVSYVRAHRIQ